MINNALVGKESGKGQLVTLRAGDVKKALENSKGPIAAGLLAGVQSLPDSAVVHQQADAWLEVAKGLK